MKLKVHNEMYVTMFFFRRCYGFDKKGKVARGLKKCGETTFMA
jgi:hypothetical protein